ncbi:MAG: PAS domain-containing protein [Terracidiphilus sp.]|jgi:PAS domain S-box-containing protein
MSDTSSAVSSGIGNTDLDAIEQLPIAYVEIDAEGRVTRSNRAARAMHSPTEEEIAGRCVWEFLPEGEAEADRRAFFEMMNSGVEPPIARRSIYANGEFRTYELHRTLIRNAQGRAVGVRGVTFDVTEAENAHEEAHRARMWLESVLDSMAEAIVITDALGFIRSVNPATEALFGWTAAELNGKVVEKAFPLLGYVSESRVSLSFNMALQSGSRGIATFIDRERRELRVEISTSPVVDKEKGFTIGVVSVMQRINDVCAFLPTPAPDSSNAS